jgi:hypothetical protein
MWRREKRLGKDGAHSGDHHNRNQSNSNARQSRHVSSPAPRHNWKNTT